MLSAHSVRFWFWSSKSGPRLHRASSSAMSLLASLGFVMIVSYCTSSPSIPDIRSDAFCLNTSARLGVSPGDLSLVGFAGGLLEHALTPKTSGGTLVGVAVGVASCGATCNTASVSCAASASFSSPAPSAPDASSGGGDHNDPCLNLRLRGCHSL